MKLRKHQWHKVPVLWLIAILSCILIISILSAITLGNVDIKLADVYGVIAFKWFKLDAFTHLSSGPLHDIVWLIRFPRILLAATVGMGLAVCGVIMQATVKNPIADPYILGISSGASLGATVAVLLGVGHQFGANAIGVMSFLGACLSSFIVVTISMRRGVGSSVGKLILAGMAISTLFSSISSFLIYMANNRNATQEIMFWTMGSLAGATWDKVAIALPIMLLGSVLFWGQFKALNVMLLGDDTALTLGINCGQLRVYYLILSSLMVGISVYVAGIIGFVGLMIPHGVRMIFGSDHKYVIPLSALLGSIFLVWADVLCRIILEHSELPIGVLISLIGAPVFIYMLLKQSQQFGGNKS